MTFKFGVTLIRYEREEISNYDLRVERVFDSSMDGTKRTDYVYIPLTGIQVRLLEGIEIPTQTISCKEEEEEED